MITASYHNTNDVLALALMMISLVQVHSSELNYNPNLQSCSSIDSDIRYGPSNVIKNLTKPEYYDFRKRPNSVYIAGEEASHTPDKTWVTLHVRSVVHIDQIEQTITTSFLEEVMWRDGRLRYNISDEAKCVFPIGFDIVENAIPFFSEMFEGIDRTMWVPSTTIVNTVDRKYGSTYGIAHPDATLHKFLQQDLTTACPMHFGQYPFDKNDCYFDVSTFMHSDSDIRLLPGGGRDNGTELVDLKNLESFRVGQFKISRETRTSNYMGDYYTLRGYVGIERAGNIFDIEIMTPDILLHISIYASFWIPADSPPARVALCIISALSFRLMRSSISSALPPVSYPLWVVDYMEASQSIAVIALIQYAFVAYLLSVQMLHESKFKQIKTSKIPSVVKHSPSKAAILFNEANQQYEEFCAHVRKAEKLKEGNFIGQAVSGFVRRMSSKVGVDQEESDIKQFAVEESVPEEIVSESMQQQQQDNTTPKSSNQVAGLGQLFDLGNSSNPGAGSSIGGSIGGSVDSKKTPKHLTKSLENASFDNANAKEKVRLPPSRVNQSFEQLMYKLTMVEVMTIAHARIAFRTFDVDGNGVLRISELQQCLRHFAKYYSTNQCCALVASYRQSQGLAFDQNPVLNLADFYCLLVELDLHEPLPEYYSAEISTISPALLVDVIARIVYPMIVALKIAIYFAILDTY